MNTASIQSFDTFQQAHSGPPAPPPPPYLLQVSEGTARRAREALNLGAVDEPTNSESMEEIQAALSSLGDAARAKEVGWTLTPVPRRGPLNAVVPGRDPYFQPIAAQPTAQVKVREAARLKSVPRRSPR